MVDWAGKVSFYPYHAAGGKEISANASVNNSERADILHYFLADKRDSHSF